MERVEQLRWALYVELLKPEAIHNLDMVAERLDDDAAAMRARNDAARKALAQRQMSRARVRLREARIHQRQVREFLLLEEPAKDTDDAK